MVGCVHSHLLQAILQMPVVSHGDNELDAPLARISNQAVQSLESHFIVYTYSNVNKAQNMSVSHQIFDADAAVYIRA